MHEMLQTTQVHTRIQTMQMCMRAHVCVCKSKESESMPKTERLICFMRLTLVYNTHTLGKEINKYTHTHTHTHIYACTNMRLCMCVCDSYPNYVLGSTAHARIPNSCSGADLSIFPFSQRVLIRQLYKTRRVTTKTHAKTRDKCDKRWIIISTALGHGQIKKKKMSKTKRTTKPPVPGEKRSKNEDDKRRLLRSVFNVFFAQEQITRIISASCPWVLFIYVCYTWYSHTHTHALTPKTYAEEAEAAASSYIFFKASMHLQFIEYIHNLL